MTDEKGRHSSRALGCQVAEHMSVHAYTPDAFALVIDTSKSRFIILPQ
jgi:hypothetical protein